MRPLRIIVCLVALCKLGMGAVGAETAGRLIGAVTDENGRPLAGVVITVTGQGAVGLYEAKTDLQGVYKVLGLSPVEPLTVRATAPGRAVVVYSGVLAHPGFGTRRDFRLRPPGSHHVLILVKPQGSWFGPVIEGARSTLPGAVTLLELTGGRLADTKALRRAMREIPNAVVAIGREAARLARREIKDVPVVHAMVPDPRGDDLVTTNLCGVALHGGFADQIDRLSLLKPEARRVVTFYDPRRLAGVVRELRTILVEHDMTLETRTVRNPRQLALALESFDGEPPDAFFLLLDPELLDRFALDQIIRFTASRELVYIVPDPSLLALGGTFSFAPGFREMGASAGRLARSIIADGLIPARIGVGYPGRREFVLNPEQAAHLGISAIAADR
jgi:putative ABC transport system substrate-binding protein